MIVGLTGASGHTGVPTLRELLKVSEITKIKVLLEKKYKRNKLVIRIAKKNKEKVEISYGDISNKEDVFALIKDCSYVINLAGVIPPLSDKNPQKSYLANEVGTYNFVEAIEKNPSIKFIDITTMALYGHRNEKHPFLRVGDPLFPGVYDFYTTHKIRGEFKLLESDIPYFVILRQTAMIYEEMLTGNLGSGIIFQTPFNGLFEWSTAEDTARLLANIIKEDLAGNLNHDNFWNKIFNIGGSECDRLSGYETLDFGFKLMGGCVKDFYEPRFNIARNFHGGFLYDGEDLNKLFHYREDNITNYWAKIGKKYKILGAARIVPKKLIKKMSIESNFKDSDSPAYWYKNKDEARIIAYFGSVENYEKLPSKWDIFEIIDYSNLKNNEAYKPIDYGFDIDKKDSEITYEDLVNVAKKHGGKLITKEFKTGDVDTKVEWENSDKERFFAKPYTVLRGGHRINPIYREYVWDYDRLAKKDDLIATYWYDTHEKDENHCYYFDEELKAKIR